MTHSPAFPPARGALLGCVLLCAVLPLPAQEEEPAAPAAQGWTASAGIGAVTMGGQTWTQISLRPEIPIGKLGIALDLTLYFDQDGQVRKSDWDEGRDLIDKIYYLRWAHKGDPVYLKAGALDDVNLGYGILVRHYSNAVQYPSVRRVGGEFDLRPGQPQIEGFLANFRELDGPGLFGLRASHPVLGKLRVGASFVMDGNLYAGMADADGDRVPDQLDRFLDHNDAREYQLWQDLRSEVGEGSELWERLRGMAGYPGDDWLDHPLPDYSKAEESLQALGADLGYELLPNLDLYFQVARFSGYGSGWAPGLRWRPLHWLSAGAEYRVWGEQFIGDFFNRTYDVERTIYRGDSLYTREELLKHAPAMKGFYADARASLFNLLTVSAAWNTMKPDEGGHDDWNSLWAGAGLDLAKVPKLKELAAYYSQVGVESLFELRTAGTMHGTRVGYELAPGALLRLDWRTTYADRNGDGRIRGEAEQDRTFLVETVFQLR
ncbi:MAG: hypothetical protein Q8O14_06180 [bacterium]|jgi:hypothetical protein|nr:hypothetical protein [bacterium]